MVRGGFEVSQWQQTPGAGSVPSVETIYTPATLPGLGAEPTYLHSQGTVGIDSRPSPGYARRGGFYGVTFHDFADPDHAFGFKQVDYEAIQHIPLKREAWVLSFRGLVETTYFKTDQQIPFFMLPSIGGGSDLRGFSSWRFRDRNSLLLQAEWRIIVNRFIDMAVFYDAGKVTAHRSDLNLDGLKMDGGLGFRFHGPLATPIRIDFAKGNEGLSHRVRRIRRLLTSVSPTEGMVDMSAPVTSHPGLAGARRRTPRRRVVRRAPECADLRAGVHADAALLQRRPDCAGAGRAATRPASSRGISA